MSTEIQVFSGTHTIGGNIISITHGKDRVLFEFGSSYDPAMDPYDGEVLYRDRSWVPGRATKSGARGWGRTTPSCR